MSLVKTAQPNSFSDLAARRHSYRDFEPNPVPEHMLHAVLGDAQRAPSNCNIQPWDVHIVSGDTRDRLSIALHAAHAAGKVSSDFFWSEQAFHGAYDQRRKEQGAIYYGNLGVARGDAEARARAAATNFSFFGAPHVAMLFMPIVGDNVRVAGDVGMYAQTFLLSLTANGLAGVPQTVLGLYADTVRDVLSIPEDRKMLFGISFGYPDVAAAANRRLMDRAPISDSVTFYG